MRIVSPHGRALDVGDGRTRLMGVLNVTPDSFSDGGRHPTVASAVEAAFALVKAGAAVLDIGGESTRPGHVRVSAGDQLARVLPVLRALRDQVTVPISIDTTLAEVAEATLDAGADWVNDTSALTDDAELARVVARRRAPIVLMHRFVPPRDGSDHEPRGKAMVALVVRKLDERARVARAAGIAEDCILLDPGIGFGTTVQDAVALLANIDMLSALGYPLVVGPSRKSFLGALTGKPVGSRAYGTAATVAALAFAGVALVRVHDVAAMQDVAVVADAIAAERGA